MFNDLVTVSVATPTEFATTIRLISSFKVTESKQKTIKTETHELRNISCVIKVLQMLCYNLLFFCKLSAQQIVELRVKPDCPAQHCAELHSST